MNMKVDFEKCDYEFYWDSITFNFVVADVPEEFVQQAKDIDGTNYLADCFGMQVFATTLDEVPELVVCIDSCDNGKFGELFYVSEDGIWNFLDYRFPEEQKREVFEWCKRVIWDEYDSEYKFAN